MGDVYMPNETNLSNNNKTAWMIRTDGEAIPCIHHIYAGEEDIDETLFAAEWLYRHTQYENTKILCLRLIKSYSVTLGKLDFISALIADIADKPYIFLTADFIKSVENELKNVDTGDVFRLCKSVENSLNNEFLRARYGGMYNTKIGCRDMYFRISSEHFNWDGIICDFVNKHKSDIDTVTIVYDEESTGMIDCFYNYNNKICNKLPVEFFAPRTGS